MAEEINSVSAAPSVTAEVAQSNQASSNNSSQSVAAPQLEPAKAVAEKMLSQSEVDKLVGKLKHESYEKGLRDAQLKTQADQLALSQIERNNSNYSEKESQEHVTDVTTDGLKSNDQIRQLIREESEKQTQLAIAQRVANEFVQKISAAKDSNKYDDFEEKITQLNLPSIPHIVGWANSLDNTADVLYDIAKDPVKYANVLMLSQTAPHLAVAQLQKLSNSIKENEIAAKQPTAAEPLSQLKPSTTGTNSGTMSVQDLRKQSWLRG
jgi:hypothetical protein